MTTSNIEAEEYLDILDEEGNRTGVSVHIGEAHEKGLLHRSVHIWFLNSQGELLLQLRSPNMVLYPNQWDMSVGGHVSAGQSSIDAALRETKEELGITLAKKDLHFLFTIREHVVQDGSRIENEFQDVYIVHSDIHEEDIQFGIKEVTAVRWITIPELKEWLAGKGESIIPHKKEYDKLFEYFQT